MAPGGTTSNVIPFADARTVDESWNDFAAHSVRLLENPRLLLDRAFMEEQARLHDRWERLFLAGDRR